MNALQASLHQLDGDLIHVLLPIDRDRRVDFDLTRSYILATTWWLGYQRKLSGLPGCMELDGFALLHAPGTPPENWRDGDPLPGMQGAHEIFCVLAGIDPTPFYGARTFTLTLEAGLSLLRCVDTHRSVLTDAITEICVCPAPDFSEVVAPLPHSREGLWRWTDPEFTIVYAFDVDGERRRLALLLVELTPAARERVEREGPPAAQEGPPDWLGRMLSDAIRKRTRHPVYRGRRNRTSSGNRPAGESPSDPGQGSNPGGRP